MKHPQPTPFAPTTATPAELALHEARTRLSEVQAEVSAAERAVAAERDDAKLRARRAAKAIDAKRDEIAAGLIATVTVDELRAVELILEGKAFGDNLPHVTTKAGTTPREFAVSHRAYLSLARCVFAALGLVATQQADRFSWSFTPAVEAALQAALAKPSVETVRAAVFAARCWLTGRHDIIPARSGVVSIGLRELRSTARRVSYSFEAVGASRIDLEQLDAFVAERIERRDYRETYDQNLKSRYSEAAQ